MTPLAQTYLQQGQNFLHAGDTARAIQSLECALSLSSDDPAAQRQILPDLVTACASAGHVKKAAQYQQQLQYLGGLPTAAPGIAQHTTSAWSPPPQPMHTPRPSHGLRWWGLLVALAVLLIVSLGFNFWLMHRSDSHNSDSYPTASESATWVASTPRTPTSSTTSANATAPPLPTSQPVPATVQGDTPPTPVAGDDRDHLQEPALLSPPAATGSQTADAPSQPSADTSDNSIWVGGAATKPTIWTNAATQPTSQPAAPMATTAPATSQPIADSSVNANIWVGGPTSTGQTSPPSGSVDTNAVNPSSAADQSPTTAPFKSDDAVVDIVAEINTRQEKRDEELRIFIKSLSAFLNNTMVKENGVRFAGFRSNPDLERLQRQAATFNVTEQGDNGVFSILFQLIQIQELWGDLITKIGGSMPPKEKLAAIQAFEQELNKLEPKMDQSLAKYFKRYMPNVLQPPEAADLLKYIRQRAEIFKESVSTRY